MNPAYPKNRTYIDKKQVLLKMLLKRVETHLKLHRRARPGGIVGLGNLIRKLVLAHLSRDGIACREVKDAFPDLENRVD